MIVVNPSWHIAVNHCQCEKCEIEYYSKKAYIYIADSFDIFLGENGIVDFLNYTLNKVY